MFSCNITAFSGRFIVPNYHLNVILIAHSLELPIILIPNGFVIYGIRKTKQLRSFYQHLVYYLSIVDFALGMIQGPLLLLLLTVYRHQSSCGLEITALVCGAVLGHISGYFVILIAIDRLLHLTLSTRYSLVMSESRKYKLLVAVFTVSITSGGVYCVASFLHVFHYAHLSITVFDTIGLFIAFTAYFYVSLHMKKVKKQRLLLWRGMTIRQRKYSRQRKISVVLRPRGQWANARTVSILLFMLLTCFLPYMVFDVWSPYRYITRMPPLVSVEIGLLWSYISVNMNSALNALVYSYRNKQLRELGRSLVWKRRKISPTTENPIQEQRPKTARFNGALNTA